MKATLVSALLVTVLFCSVLAGPLSAESNIPEVADYVQKLEMLKKLHLPGSIRYEEQLETPLNRQIVANLLKEARRRLEAALANVDPSDSASLIELQVAQFIFTNTVASVSGTISAISSATSAAAQSAGS